MIKVSTIEVEGIDSDGDFTITSKCSCGYEQYTILNTEEAHALMYFLKKELRKHDDLLTIKNKTK